MKRPCTTCQQSFEVGKSNTRRTCSPECYRIWKNEMARQGYYKRQSRQPKPKHPKIDPDFGHWFAGFTDGEGCFLIHPVKVKGVTYYAAKFVIRLRDDDLPILTEIQRCLGFGRIHRFTRQTHTPGANPGASFEVANAYECWRLVEIFEHYPLRAKKRRDFDIWKRFVELHKIRPNATNGELAELCVALKRVRQYSRQQAF